MAADIEALIARDVANGVPERSARRKWASVLAWTESADDPVFWTNPADASAPELEASATAVAPDPALQPRSAEDTLRSRMVAAGYTPREADVGVRQEAGMPYAFQAPPSDETLRWGGAYMRDQDRRAGAFDRSLDGIYERPEPVVSHSTAPAGVDTTYYDSVTGGLPGAVGVVIDGVFVPGRLNARGEVMTTIGDERRAKEAKADKAWKSQIRASIEEDKARYGWDKPLNLRTPAQIDAAKQRRDSERRVRENPSHMLVSAQRYSESTGIPVAEALKLLEADAQRNAQLTADIAADPNDDDSARYAERDSIGAGRKQLAILSRQVASDRRREAREKHSRNMQLVGGSQNMNPAVRARLGTLDALGDDSGMNEWQKMVLADSMLRGGAGPVSPLVVDQARAAAAGDLAKVGVMGREADARMAAIQAQIEQSRGDRQAQSEQFQARMDADAEARRMQQEQFMAKMAQDAAEAERRFGLGSKEAEARHAALLAQIEQNKAENARMMMQFQQQSAAAAAEREARERMHYAGLETEMSKTAAILGKDRDATAAARADAARARELQFMQSSPGLYDVMTGKADTPAAIRALKAIASQSEDTWTEDILDPTVYATLGFADSGFDAGNARRMNDELKRMAKQAELLGLDTRLNDPAYRRDLINSYGFNSGWAGGQGGWFGSLWRTMPEDLQ